MDPSQAHTHLAMLGLILLVGLASSASISTLDPCDREDANGCSSPFDFPFKKEFTPSCNRHDICYGCAVAYGFDKDDCDTAFLKDLTATCKTISVQSLRRTQVKDTLGRSEGKAWKSPESQVNACERVSKLLEDAQEQDCHSNNLKYVECMATADTAYGAVRLFGDSHFDKVPEGYCQKPFVPACLPKKTSV